MWSAKFQQVTLRLHQSAVGPVFASKLLQLLPAEALPHLGLLTGWRRFQATLGMAHQRETSDRMASSAGAHICMSLLQRRNPGQPPGGSRRAACTGPGAFDTLQNG